jgi:AcrR family transcriptional regulator
MTKNVGESAGIDFKNPRKTAASKIFDTARELFYRRGVRDVGVDEIVCEAGVTKPSLYRAFKSKDELVAACLRESGREGREEIEAALAAAGDDPRARLDAFLRVYSDKLGRADFRGCPMSNVAVEMPEAGHPAREVLEQCKSDTRAIAVCLARELGVAHPEALADGLILIIEGAIASHHVFGSQGPAHSMLATCEALIESHLAGREPLAVH